MTKRTLKKINVLFALLLSIIVFALPITSRAGAIITIANYEDWDFYGESDPEPVLLQRAADTISLYAECEEGETDTITFFICDITHNGLYDSSYQIPADGTAYTIVTDFPAGRYIVYAEGDSDILKVGAGAVFVAFIE